MHFNNDVKEAVIEDARRCLLGLEPDRVEGVLVTGDIAYSGKESEYQTAGHWLDQLTAAIGCKRTKVRVVPGNHDLDRNFISEGIGEMLDKVEAEGEEKLLNYLKNEHDRNALLLRFGAYQKFAEAYDCSLDTEGGWAGNHLVELDGGRSLRILGVNSALICKKKDTKGQLLLGTAQLTLQPRRLDEELLVLTHHPLDWFRDAETAGKYVRKRARFYLSGHEHSPGIKLEAVGSNADLLMIASGATVPPTDEGPPQYCYNIIVFETVLEKPELCVTVLPRKWDASETEFVEDQDQLKAHGRTFPVRCPNFKNGAVAAVLPSVEHSTEVKPDQPPLSAVPPPPLRVHDDDFALVKLRFFRDLSDKQRIETLVALGAVPATLMGGLSHSVQRRCLEQLYKDGKLQLVKDHLDTTPL